MSGVLDFLFQGQAPSAVTTYGQSTQQLPAWWNDYAMGILSKANAVAAEPYTPYGQPRIASPNTDMTNAWQSIRDSLGSATPYIQQANNLFQKVGGGFNAGDFNQFMNPYTDAVVNKISDLGARNLREKLLPEVGDVFTKSGQFGSTRHEDFVNRALRDTNEAILNQQSDALSSGFNSSLGAYQKSLDQANTAGSQLGVLGQLAQSTNLRDAAALEGVGTTQRGIEQSNLDTAYQDFINQRDYPKSNITFLNNMLRGINAPTSTATAQDVFPSNYGPSILAQLAGAGTGLAALSGLKLSKRGGRIKKPNRSILINMGKAA